MRKVNIAIDGTAGAGKSTVARQLADRLKLRYLDTGAMYRAVTFLALSMELAPGDEDSLISLADKLEFGLNESSEITMNGQALGEEIVKARI